MKISYYELLGMIKEGNIPNEVLVTLQNGLKPVKYFADFDYVDDSLTCYSICDEEEIDENYHNYLTDCFIEMSVFDKCIEIIEEKKEIEKGIKPYKQYVGELGKDGYGLSEINEEYLERLSKIVIELIDEVKKLKKE